MAKPKKLKFPFILDAIDMVTEKTGVPVLMADFGDQPAVGMYDIEEQAIYILHDATPSMQFITLVHETAHHLHITVGGHQDATLIDQEVIAFAIEQIIFQKMTIPQAIKYATKKVQKCYKVYGQVSTVTPEDVAEIESQIKDIFEL